MSIADISPADIAAARSRIPDAFESGDKRIKQFLMVLGGIAYLAFCIWVFDITLEKLFGGLGKMGHVIYQMVIWKDFLSWDFSGIFVGLAETLGMALLGTTIASLFAIVLGFVAAKNVVANIFVHHLIRRFLDLLRGIDTLIWALVFVRAVGLGPLAGVIGLDPRGSQFQRRTVFVPDPRHLCLDLGWRKGQRLGRQHHPVVPRCQLDQCCIPARAHIGDDGGHGGIHILGLLALGAQNGGKPHLEISIRCGKKDRHNETPTPGPAR